MATSDSVCKTIRIVHISDTHMNHHHLASRIPTGDIFIHSGDFLDLCQRQDFEECLKEIDTFFRDLPHTHKLFVAGNHEMCFKDKTKQDIKNGLPNVIYLEDEYVVIEGLKIYGTPWNRDRGSHADAYVASDEMLQQYWQQIPDDTDILVTHNPPHRIHDNIGAMGCRILRDQVIDRIRPTAHLFGHTHKPGTTVRDGILFSNAACHAGNSKPHAFNLLVDTSKRGEIQITQDS